MARIDRAARRVFRETVSGGFAGIKLGKEQPVRLDLTHGFRHALKEGAHEIDFHAQRFAIALSEEILVQHFDIAIDETIGTSLLEGASGAIKPDGDAIGIDALKACGHDALFVPVELEDRDVAREPARHGKAVDCRPVEAGAAMLQAAIALALVARGQ